MAETPGQAIRIPISWRWWPHIFGFCCLRIYFNSSSKSWRHTEREWHWKERGQSLGDLDNLDCASKVKKYFTVQSQQLSAPGLSASSLGANAWISNRTDKTWRQYPMKDSMSRHTKAYNSSSAASGQARKSIGVETCHLIFYVRTVRACVHFKNKSRLHRPSSRLQSGFLGLSPRPQLSTKRIAS